MESTHTEQPMSGTAWGNVPPWFASGEERGLAWRWALSSALATVHVWWFRAQGVELLLLLFLYQLFLAISSYTATGRRRFLAICAMPLLGVLAVPVLAVLGVWEHELVWLTFDVVSILAWPVLGVMAVAALVNPQRVARRQRAYGIAAALAGLGLYAKSVFMLSTDSFRTLDAAEVSGCYRLLRGMSFPSMERPLPTLVKLDTARWTDADTLAPNRDAAYFAGEHRLSPAAGSLTGHWQPAGRGLLRIGWTYRGLGGVTGDFRRDGRDLVGRLRWFQDLQSPLPHPVLSVRFKRAECPAGVPGDLPEPPLTVAAEPSRRR